MGPRQDHTGEGGDRQLGQCPEQAGLLGSASQPRRQEPGKEDRSIFRREPFCSKACWCHLASVEERLHLTALPPYGSPSIRPEQGNGGGGTRPGVRGPGFKSGSIVSNSCCDKPLPRVQLQSEVQSDSPNAQGENWAGSHILWL